MQDKQRKPNWLSVLLGSALILLVVLAEGMTWFSIAFLLVIAASLIYSGFVRPDQQFVRYALGRYELTIHSNKGKRLLPYEKVKAFTVQSFSEKPVAIEGELSRGYAHGLFRLGRYEVTLYATRRDRLVLLDTEDGLIGLTPAADCEDAFLEALAAKSKAVRVQDGFALAQGRGYVPEHATKSPAIWPILLFGTLVNLVITQFENTYLPSGALWFDVGSVALVVIVAILYRPLWHLHRLQPWLFPVLSVLLILMLFAI